MQDESEFVLVRVPPEIAQDVEKARDYLQKAQDGLPEGKRVMASVADFGAVPDTAAIEFADNDSISIKDCVVARSE